MKAVILAGGYGTRISEESGIRPKPMVELGGKPILWHIMKIYHTYGINDFIICAGYKSHAIKEYFANYALYNSDVTFDLTTHTQITHKNGAEPWKITVVETGENTMTGGRLKRVKDYVGNETFLCTYGDGVSDVNITDTIAFHKKHGGVGTVIAVQPPGRFGIFSLNDGNSTITSFREKPNGDGAWINGGFMVLTPEVFDYIKGDDTVFEQEPMENMAKDGKLNAFRHNGYWQCMDTLRDKMMLESIWQTGKAPWKVW